MASFSESPRSDSKRNLSEIRTDALPHTTFRKSTLTGVPIIRPMWYEFPQDTNTFSLDQQFMFGESFLVVPKTAAPDLEHIEYHTPTNTPVYLPDGTFWYYYSSG